MCHSIHEGIYYHPCLWRRLSNLKVTQAACGREKTRHPDALCPWLVTPDPSAGLSSIEPLTMARKAASTSEFTDRRRDSEGVDTEYS